MDYLSGLCDCRISRFGIATWEVVPGYTAVTIQSSIGYNKCPLNKDIDNLGELSLMYRPVISQDVFLISGFFTNLPLPHNVLERREIATKERKK